MALTLVHADGSEHSLTWKQLECNANQWARALAQRAVGLGDLVALSIPNSLDLDPRCAGGLEVRGRSDPHALGLAGMGAAAAAGSHRAQLVRHADNCRRLAPPSICGTTTQRCRRSLSPCTQRHLQFRIHRSTQDHLQHLPRRSGLRRKTIPFMAQWAPVSQPQTILVPAPMYHTNGFNSTDLPAQRRQPGGAREVRCRNGTRHNRAAPHHAFHRDTDHAVAHRRPAWCRGPRPVQCRVDHAGRRGHAAHPVCGGGSTCSARNGW